MNQMYVYNLKSSVKTNKIQTPKTTLPKLRSETSPGLAAQMLLPSPLEGTTILTLVFIFVLLFSIVLYSITLIFACLDDILLSFGKPGGEHKPG